MFALLILFFLAIGLVFLMMGFIASFIISKTGIFFIGILLACLSLGICDINLMLLLFNFIFNRKSNKKQIIWTFIISIIIFGISLGLIFNGSLKFDYISLNDNLKTNTFNIEMQDNLYIENYKNIEYIEKDINDIEIEVKTNTIINVKNHITSDGEIYFYTYTPNMKTVFDTVIKNLNKNKIVEYDHEIHDMKVYASSENINKLKENQNK